MEYQKITNLLGNVPDNVPRFITKKWIEVHDQSGETYNRQLNRQVILKSNAPFISCISKINGVLVENPEDLGIVIPMYNLLEYSKNYSKTSASL